MELLLSIFVALGAAFLCSTILKHFGVPRVIGQIAAGLLLSYPVLKQMFYPDATLLIFSDLAGIGIVLLFFFIGLELNLRAIRKDAKEAVLISLFNTLIPFLIGLAIGLYYPSIGLLGGIIIGIAFAVSSQTVTFDLLEESGLFKGRIGRLIVTSGAIDDLLEFVFISIVLTAIQLTQLAIFSIFANILLFIVIIALFKFLVIPQLLKLFEAGNSQSILFMGALIIAALMGSLAELLDLSSLIGAFVAGVLVRQVLLSEGRNPWREHALSHNLHIISYGFFVPLFFIYVGLTTDIFGNLANLQFAILLTVLTIIGTIIGSTIGVLLSGRGVKEGLVMGLGVTPKGDVELAIVVLALQNRVISLDLYSSLVIMAVLTTFIAPFLFRYFANKWKKELR